MRERACASCLTPFRGKSRSRFYAPDPRQIKITDTCRAHLNSKQKLIRRSSGLRSDGGDLREIRRSKSIRFISDPMRAPDRSHSDSIRRTPFFAAFFDRHRRPVLRSDARQIGTELRTNRCLAVFEIAGHPADKALFDEVVEPPSCGQQRVRLAKDV